MAETSQGSPPLPIEEIRKLRDPSERAREAVRFAGRAEERAREGRAIRDEAIREMKASGMSLSEIARRSGVNINTVKVVVR